MIKVDWQSCFSMSDDVESMKLEEWCKEKEKIVQRELICLEIGAFQGKSTALLAQFGPVITIDLFGNVEDGLGNYGEVGQKNFVPFIQNMIRLQLIERVSPICTTSRVLVIIPPLNADIIYIDGAHTYQEVLLDIERALPHLAKDGWMIVDDYKRRGFGYPPFEPGHPHHGPVDPWFGVAKAVDKVLKDEKLKIKEHYLGKVCLERS